MRTLLMAIALATVLSASAPLAPVASATVLFDQSDFDPWGPGFFNSESGMPPMGITQYAVNDVTVGATGWTIDSITTYYSALDPAWGTGITQGYLHIFAKIGPLPIDGVDDPTASPLISMSASLDVDHFVLTASGLNVQLQPGDYWIGITPIAPNGVMGPEIHLASMTLIGDATASYDPYAFPGPPAWYNLNPGTDAAIHIEGIEGGATPVEAASWGRLKALYQD